MIVLGVLFLIGLALYCLVCGSDIYTDRYDKRLEDEEQIRYIDEWKSKRGKK